MLEAILTLDQHIKAKREPSSSSAVDPLRDRLLNVVWVCERLANHFLDPLQLCVEEELFFLGV